MALISYITEQTATGTSLTYPSGINAGDYILYYGYRTTTTAPSLPSGFTNPSSPTASANGNSERVCYKVAAGTESGTTSPTFANATQVTVVVYRNVTGIGASSVTTHASGSNSNIPALTLTGTNGLSWVVGFSGSSQGTSQSTPAGVTKRAELKNSTTSMIDGYDTNGGVSSFSAMTVTLGSAGNSASCAVELLATNTAPNAPAPYPPVTLDATASTTDTTHRSSGYGYTLSHTVGSGSNTALVVSLSMWLNGGTPTAATSVSLGSQSFTAVGNGVSNTNGIYTEQWVLANPTTGAGTITVTSSSTLDKMGIASASFFNVNQTTVYDVATSATGTVVTVTASLTTTQPNEYLVDAVAHWSANLPSSSTGTQIYAVTGSDPCSAAQYKQVGAAGSNSMSWTFPDAGDDWAYSVLAIKPSSPPTTVSSTTPTVNFFATDPDGNNVSYETQVDTLSTFNSNTHTPAWVQSTNGNTLSGSSYALTAFGSNVTAGNLIVVAVEALSLTVSSVTDNQSNTYQKAVSKLNSLDSELWYAYNVGGGNKPTITVNLSSAGSSAAIAQEFSGIVSASNPLDQTASNSGSSGSPSSGTTAITSQGEELIVAAAALGGSLSVGTGYSNFVNKADGGAGNDCGMESKVASSTGTQSATFGGSSASWASTIATFKAYTAPLIDALSATGGHDAAQFADVTNPGDTDPFPSGDAMSYTVPGGETLTNGTTYYWRVRGIDPSGSNTWGSWSNIYSFTVSAGTGPVGKDIGPLNNNFGAMVSQAVNRAGTY